MPLTQDEIAKLLTKKSRRGTEPSPRRELPPGYKSKALSVRKGIGPIQFVNERGQCKSGTFSEELQERFECKVPTYTQFQGVYYCSLHALNLANEMLISKEVLS